MSNSPSEKHPSPVRSHLPLHPDLRLANKTSSPARTVAKDLNPIDIDKHIPLSLTDTTLSFPHDPPFANTIHLLLNKHAHSHMFPQTYVAILIIPTRLLWGL